MTADNWIQLSIAVFTLITLLVTVRAIIKKSNEELFNKQYKNLTDYMALSNQVNQLQARVDIVDKYNSEERLAFKEQYKIIEQSLKELHEKINKHFLDYHSKKEG